MSFLLRCTQNVVLICPHYAFIQVTVAHINATAKNAADDKLRQSLRRFANTHTAPATVVLVSSKYGDICSFQLNSHVGIVTEAKTR